MDLATIVVTSDLFLKSITTIQGKLLTLPIKNGLLQHLSKAGLQPGRSLTTNLACLPVTRLGLPSSKPGILSTANRVCLCGTP